MTVNVYPIRYTRAALDRADDDERMFFLLAGHFSNDLSILQKQMIFASNGSGRGEVSDLSSMAVVMLMARFLVGRIVAAWELVQREKYRDLMTAALEELSAYDGMGDTVKDAQQALTVLNADLVDGGLLSTIRRKASAHTDKKLLSQAYDKLPEDVVLVDLLAAARGNALYGSADEISVRVLLDLTGHDDIQSATEALIDIASRASGAMEDYLQAYLAAFHLKYVGEDAISAAIKAPIELEAPALKAVSIPFFVDAAGFLSEAESMGLN